MLPMHNLATFNNESYTRQIIPERGDRDESLTWHSLQEFSHWSPGCPGLLRILPTILPVESALLWRPRGGGCFLSPKNH